MADRPIHYRSLREHIEALRELGELSEVDQEVDWNLEIGAITRRICETGGPAVLFNRIKGIEPGFRVLGAPAAASARPDRPLARVATSIGLPPEASPHEIVDTLARARDCKPISPRQVATAPCKQNILVGPAVDLMRLPAPMIHVGDGGRFLDTWGTTITRTPEGDWTNWAVSRTMLRDRTSTTGPTGAVFQLRGGQNVPRLMIVRDDIEPASARDVLWALTTRCHPGSGEVAFPHLATNPREAFLRSDEKAAMFTTKAVFNCLPIESWTAGARPVRASFDKVYPADLQARILRDWTRVYGPPEL